MTEDERLKAKLTEAQTRKLEAETKLFTIQTRLYPWRIGLMVVGAFFVGVIMGATITP